MSNLFRTILLFGAQDQGRGRRVKYWDKYLGFFIYLVATFFVPYSQKAIWAACFSNIPAEGS